MKQMENEMNVNVPLEVIKASEIEPKEVKWLWYSDGNSTAFVIESFLTRQIKTYKNSRNLL